MEFITKTLAALRAREPATLKRLGLFAVVALVAVLVMFSSLGPAETGAIADSKPKVSAATMYVNIVGAVVRPGVYPVDQTTRLFEVVSSAGGFAKRADQGSVNLARLVADGEQIIVLFKGSAGQAPESKLLSLNAATQSQLEELPGVGPTLAGRIIDFRAANGGFKKVDDLLKVGGIGDKLFAGIRNMVSP